MSIRVRADVHFHHIAAFQQRRIGLLGLIDLDRELGVLKGESEEGGELVGLRPLDQLAQPCFQGGPFRLVDKHVALGD